MARDRGEPARAAPPDRVLPTEREQILAETRDEISYRGRFTDRAPGAAGQGLPERSEEREASAAPATAPPPRGTRPKGKRLADRTAGAVRKSMLCGLAGSTLTYAASSPTRLIVRQLAEEERREHRHIGRCRDGSARPSSRPDALHRKELPRKRSRSNRPHPQLRQRRSSPHRRRQSFKSGR